MPTADMTSPPHPTPAKQSPRSSGQGLCCVWHGINRSNWRKIQQLAGPFPAENRLRRWSISAISWLNSWHEFWENVLFGRRVAATKIEHPPIFILGHWRSGTTLLHNLFALDEQFTFPNLYQVMFSGHFLLTETVITALTGWALPKTRPMDNIPAGWKMSQEDEVALLLRTLVSPYAMLLFQGDRPKYERTFDLTELSDAELTAWKAQFLLLLKKLTLRSNRPVILKSPSHTYRIPLLLELFPNAKFVYIHRDPYAVYNSSVHLRKTIFTENALGHPNFAGLEEDALVTYEHCIHRYESTKALIPPGQLHEVRFDQLEADPLGQMQQVYQALHLPGWDQVAPKIQAQMGEHASYRKNKFSMDPVTMQRIYSRLKFAFELYGYPSRLDDSTSFDAA